MANIGSLKRTLILCAALLLSTTAAWSAQASFEDGVRAYLAQDYAAALKAWKPLANQGYAPAQFGMGLSYENGRAVQRDPAQAAIWYRKAAEQDLADAQFNLGNLYLNALGVPKNLVEAVRWFRRAAQQDMPHAQVNLGFSYETGSGVAKDPVKAVTWYRRAAAQNFPQAQYYLGTAYERGSGVEVDLLVATGWYQMAANQGVVLAVKRLDALRQNSIEASATISAAKGASAKEVPPRNREKPPKDLQSPIPSEDAPAVEPKESIRAEGIPSNKSPASVKVEKTNLIKNASPLEPELPREPSRQDKPSREEAVEARIEPTTAEEAESPQREKPKSEGPNAKPASETARSGKRLSTLEGSYRLRLASYRKPGNADKGWLILAGKHADLLTDFDYAIAEVDLGAGKGIYHRLEAGPVSSFSEAVAICTEIKLSGNSCVVVRP